MEQHNYNAHHSPVGAFASFTLGFRGAQGGLGLELGGPANQDIYIGVEDGEQTFHLLPFFDGAAGAEEALRYDVEGNQNAHPDAGNYVGKAEDGPVHPPITLRPLENSAISREFQLTTDTWSAPEFSFTVYSPVHGVPNPQEADASALKAALLPAVLCELSIDNTENTSSRRAVFGFTGKDAYSGMRRLDDVSEGAFVGIGEGRNLAIASNDVGVTSAVGFSLSDILTETLPANYAFGLGQCAALICEVPAGEKRTFQFAVCFHREGNVTAGVDMSYAYARYFPNVESVASYALAHFPTLKQSFVEANDLVSKTKLSTEQKWMLCHAVRSYYGSTQILEHQGELVWVVNEGEYRMMNTFDLTVDHLFWELRQNPWAVKNQLEWFVQRYSYEDKVRLPGDKTEYSGGLSFTHDMGVTNVWSRHGYSSYEKAGLKGVFSYMTHEQMVNWLCCATVYVEHTEDREWLEKRWPVFEQCFQSLLNRDHPDPLQRRGLMQLDSTRCQGGAEITTYDSLDVSLGQARNNIYLASKIWASYLGLEKLFRQRGDEERARLAQQQAVLTSKTLLAHVGDDGTIAAVLEGGNQSKIIPAIEGLIFPYFNGRRDALEPEGEFGPLVTALRTHLKAVLKPGVCLFENGAWKLSSTSDNSWLSKIYLCQFVARQILGLEWDENGRQADSAHVEWLLDKRNAYFCWSDQMLAGVAVGSKYYPRGVTSTLWLDEN
ncbi:beta-xylosidase [bacterium]|nr:MAG: beta-xylosidase [bacterium]